jgi:DNA-binding LytR/AlgR family response regulator
MVGLLLGFAGPFGSYPAYPRATRYAFWLGLTLVGVAAALAADAVLPRSRLLHVHLIRTGAVALVSALPMTFVVAWTMSLVQPGRVFTPQQLPALFVAVAAVQLLVVYATRTSAPKAAGVEPPAAAAAVQKHESEPVSAATFPTALLNKLPPEIGRDIIALETEDHYLRVHAVGGSALILMRMADAVVMLDPQLGAQVHRRWWVAEGAVAGMRMDAQKLSLQLSDNSLVPVGRTFSAAVRARFANVCNTGANRQAPNARKGPLISRA